MATNIPPIAEKIKFWEEQDKINQAVIPRIIEMNESLKSLTNQLGEVDKKIINSESRILSKVKDDILNTKSNNKLIFIAIGISLIALIVSILK